MVAILVSAEQVRSAPAEVRAWLEQLVAGECGFQGPARAVPQLPGHVVGCDVATAREVLSAIQRSLPVAAVFFDLAHEPLGVSPQGLRVLRLDEMARRCRLGSASQVVACLGTMDAALRTVTGDAQAAMTAVDDAGHCLVPEVTARSIFTLWQEMAGTPDGGFESGTRVA